MNVGQPEPIPLAKELPNHEIEWAEIVRKYDLTARRTSRPSSANLSPSLILALATACATDRPFWSALSSLRQAGFHDCIDTEEMLRKWIARLSGAVSFRHVKTTDSSAARRSTSSENAYAQPI